MLQVGEQPSIIFFSVILLGETHLFNIAKMYFTIGRYDSVKKHCNACCTEVYLGNTVYLWKHIIKTRGFFSSEAQSSGGVVFPESISP